MSQVARFQNHHKRTITSPFTLEVRGNLNRVKLNTMNQDNTTDNIGRTFIWIAWVIALGLFGFLFQDLLDSQHNPNNQPASFIDERGKAEVHLKQNRQGHYLSSGRINDVSVNFLLDTGATSVSIPAHIADKLNLPDQGNYMVNTANGRVKVFKTTIDQLSIGNIFLYNVEANINPGMQSNEILLGMSALKQVEFSQTGKQLILREQD